MMRPLVSIITPCYNSERFIERYLECLLRQTYHNVQLIIVNDGSKDRTEDIVYGYKARLENTGITLTYQYQNNLGLGGAINTGLKLVEGEFFTWCDSDNLLTDDYIEVKVAYFLEHPEAQIVRCDGYNVLDSAVDKPISRMSDGLKNRFETKLFLNCLTCKEFYFGCTMLRTSAFEEVNPQREIYQSREGQNWQIMLPMLYHYEAHYIDKPMFFFVIREDSISHAAAHKGADAMIKQNSACEETEAIVIKAMHVPEEKEYLDIIYKQYSMIRFWITDQYGKLNILEEEYGKMSQNGWLTDEVKKTYNRWMNPLWRIGHKLRGRKQ